MTSSSTCIAVGAIYARFAGSVRASIWSSAGVASAALGVGPGNCCPSCTARSLGPIWAALDLIRFSSLSNASRSDNLRCTALSGTFFGSSPTNRCGGDEDGEARLLRSPEGPDIAELRYRSFAAKNTSPPPSAIIVAVMRPTLR